MEMSKTAFIKEMEKLYEQVQELGITAHQLASHIHSNVSLPKEEGWIALEELIRQTGLIKIRKTPQCYGYEVTAEAREGALFHILFEESKNPKLKVTMYDEEGLPWGYEEKWFRNPREVGNWLRRTITDFLTSYQDSDSK
ncbi:hypothetical protein [Ammoniphilus sp. YIM 78166]|uniref:hypothetical protein n=1 Tax=Ammoniphilus sp. YIM 78166 TaxID=1644106 RepID=UPI00106FB072|nr:hypothetical protein [Ammoniphilus sp. YIM 78166]